jgi:putative ABC transport system permease protein
VLNLGRVHLSKPIELLYGGNVGEREPKTKWLLALIGIVGLASAYIIANTVADPVAALGWFFIAVLLVIGSTYCLFIAGSIAFLKLLRRNKNYYYKTNHFTAVSGMLYRMKQNAAGLAASACSPQWCS